MPLVEYYGNDLEIVEEVIRIQKKVGKKRRKTRSNVATSYKST